MTNKLTDIDEVMKSSDKIIEYHIGKKLQIDPEKIEFRRKKISENIFDAIIYIDGERLLDKIDEQQLEDLKKYFCDLGCF